MNVAPATRDEIVTQLMTTENLEATDFQCGTDKVGFKKDVAKGMVFRLGRKEYQLSRGAFTKAARICGIPESYIAKFPDEDLGYVVTHLDYWFNHRTDELRVLSHDDMAIAFAKASIGYYSRLELFEAAEQQLGKDGLLYSHINNSVEGGLYYTLISHKKTEVKKGDLLRGGIQVQDHILGELPLTVSATVLRLVCTNGAVSIESVQKWSRRNDEASVKDWFIGAVDECYKAVDDEFTKVRKLAEVKLQDHGAEVIASLFAEYKVGIKARETIMDNIVNGHADTLYDVYNAITEAANDAELAISPSAVRGLQQVAGGLATHSQFCLACYRVLK